MSRIGDLDIQITEELITELRQMQYRYSQPAVLLADHRSVDVREAAKVWARKAERIGQVIDAAAHAWTNADQLEALSVLSSRAETQEIPRVH